MKLFNFVVSVIERVWNCGRKSDISTFSGRLLDQHFIDGRFTPCWKSQKCQACRFSNSYHSSRGKVVFLYQIEKSICCWMIYCQRISLDEKRNSNFIATLSSIHTVAWQQNIYVIDQFLSLHGQFKRIIPWLKNSSFFHISETAGSRLLTRDLTKRIWFQISHM